MPNPRLRRYLTVLAIPILTVLGLAAPAHATEAHVSASCNPTTGLVTVSVFATDHGKTATVTDAYVLNAAGAFDGALSGTLRDLFGGTVLTTGAELGEPGPTVGHPLEAPDGLHTYALTLTFSDGTTSTGRAAVTTPCTPPPTTTVPPTTIVPTTVPPVATTRGTVAATTSVATTVPPLDGTVVVRPTAQPQVESDTATTAPELPKTGANGAATVAVLGGGLVAAGALLLAARRRMAPR